MQKKLILVLFFAAAFALGAQEFQTAQSIGMNFQWRFVEEGLEIKLSGPTTGWIAIGFNPDQIMQDADFKIGFVDEDGKPQLFDHYGHSRFGHREDEKNGGTQDFSALQGSEKNGVTELSFILPLNSGDGNDKVFTKGETYRVLFAYGTSDQFRKHKARSGMDIKL